MDSAEISLLPAPCAAGKAEDHSISASSSSADICHVVREAQSAAEGDAQELWVLFLGAVPEWHLLVEQNDVRSPFGLV